MAYSRGIMKCFSRQYINPWDLKLYFVTEICAANCRRHDATALTAVLLNWSLVHVVLPFLCRSGLG